LLGLVLLLALFHRPIFFEATRYFLLRAARQQNLDLDYEMRGSIFTTLSVVNLKATPTGPGPIQRLEIGTLNLQYSLWDLFRDGLPTFLKQLDIRNVFIELTPSAATDAQQRPGFQPLPPDREQKPQAFKFPALFPEMLNIENGNLVVHAATGDTVLKEFFFSLLPDRTGALKIQALDIPGVHNWADITAATTFRERNLVLSDLFVGQEIALRELNLDLSNLEKDELKVALDGTFFDAPVQLNASVTDLNESNQLTVIAKTDGLVFAPVWKYLNLAIPLGGRLGQLAVSFQGEPAKPSSWQGRAKTRLKKLEFEGRAFGDVTVDTTVEHGQAQVSLRDDLDEKNSLTVMAEGVLPGNFADFRHTRVQGYINLALPEAGRLPLPEPMAGDLRGLVDFHLADGLLSAKATLESGTLAVAGAELTKTRLTFRLEKDLNGPDNSPVFQALTTDLDGRASTVSHRGCTVDALHVRAASRDGRVTVEEVTFAKNANTARIAADYVLPDDLKSWVGQPLKLDLTVDAPQLESFVTPGGGVGLKGKLHIDGKMQVQDQIANGAFAVSGRKIEVNGLPIRTADAQVTVVNNHIRISKADIVLDDKNHLRGEGEIQWGDTWEYWGNLDVQLADLSLFQPLLGGGPKAPKLGGKLTTFWKGSGDAKTPRHFGTASLDLSGGQFGEQKCLASHFNASYAPDHINIPDFLVTSDLANATFSLFWKNDRLAITHLAVRQKKLTLLEGNLDLPFHLAEFQTPDQLLPDNEPLQVMLKSESLNLATAFKNSGQKNPPILGAVNLAVDANGTLAELQGKLALRATGIKSPTAPQVDPADVSLDLTLSQNRLQLDGTVKQKPLQPMHLTGNLPFPAGAILRAGKLDPRTPVDFRISLPATSLDFFASVVPALRTSRGSAAMDIRAEGTLSQPTLSGNVIADVSILRFSDPSLPPINNVALRLAFLGDRMSIERCVGGIAGGAFDLTGGMDFTRLDNPILDLRFRARNALVVQNDDMTARVNSDLRVTGPLNAGQVKGALGITRSRFFKNIDILPIGLPGRPAPQPPQDPTVISFPNPPLRDWTFDVAITTDDPFLVQSNLAGGKITANLHLGGTGLSPWMEGKVEIEHLSASLPFSRLNINSGEIFFTRQQPFIPQLNLRCTSAIREYNVTVFLTGPVTDPQAIFTSEPPLTQTEVVSLIATGMTTSELQRNPNALAGRAAILLFQKLYNRVFRRNQPPPDHDTFFNRIRFDVGTIDPKTGHQATLLGVPLSDNLMLTGGLDVGGNFQGQIKYLIRFK
jgi:autotransporter translocation and assembly factor TamB